MTPEQTTDPRDENQAVADASVAEGPATEGSLADGIKVVAEFVRTLRARAAGEDAIPNGEVHANVLSVAMVEAAVRSAETGQRVALATVVEDAYETAVTTEPDAEVRAVLASWTSVLEVVGLENGGSNTPAHQLTSSGEVR